LAGLDPAATANSIRVVAVLAGIAAALEADWAKNNSGENV